MSTKDISKTRLGHEGIPDKCYDEDVRMDPNTEILPLRPLLFWEKHMKRIRLWALNAISILITIEAYKYWS
jgi:hypothetical protein